MSMGGQAEGLACANQGAWTPIGVSGNFVTQNKMTEVVILKSESGKNIFGGCCLSYQGMSGY